MSLSGFTPMFSKRETKRGHITEKSGHAFLKQWLLCRLH